MTLPALQSTPAALYIEPNTRVHSTFADAKEFHEKSDGFFSFREEKPPSIADLAQGSRNLIVGEPGIGKTLLLNKIKEQLDIQGAKTGLILLRGTDIAGRIDDFLEATAAEVS